MAARPSPEQAYDPVVILRLMGKGTIRTVLDPSSIFLQVCRISRTVCAQVQRAVTKQAVEFLKALMAGKILAIPVLKKTI